MRIAFVGGAVKVVMPGRFEGAGNFQLDAGNSPKRIEITSVEGKNRFAVRQGIYSLEGDVLKLCLGEPEELPTAFASAEGTQVMYFVFRRATPADQGAGK